MKRDSRRPALPSRHKMLSDLNRAIYDLWRKYQDEGDPVYLTSIKLHEMFKGLIEANELLYRQEEIEETYQMIEFGQLPHSVTTWFLYYRDKEIS